MGHNFYKISTKTVGKFWATVFYDKFQKNLGKTKVD